ncbi:putative pectinesterase/pectinesterase inhibitor 26 [Camellia lanceoleosa]|uniref:Pectinesterase/pectinesterase inhibitor 26 n=1 Tax=Camellia lanceoleosa TaxID=1840588 RepID=A0ACC0FD20_9ERIC|nr:putative pectinesterase/pectinesterase inhibitor 26 [Camellia lanceoleosa]
MNENTEINERNTVMMENRVSLLESNNGEVIPRKARVTLIGSLIFLFNLLIGTIIGALLVHKYTTIPINYPWFSTDSAESIRVVCSVTHHPHSCFTTISSSALTATTNIDDENDFTPIDPQFIFALSLRFAIIDLANLSYSLPKALISKSTESRTELALRDCASLFDNALGQLNRSASMMKKVVAGEAVLTDERIEKMKKWIGAAMSDQERCLDGVKEMMESTAGDEVRKKVQESKVYVSNSLAILSNLKMLIDGGGELNFFEFKLYVCIFCLEFMIVIWLFCLLFRIR